MSWEKNSSFLVLSFVTTESISLQKKPSYKTADFAKNPDTQKEVKWNFTVQSSQNPISHNKTDIWSNILCMCIADPVCTPATTENGIFFSTRISRKLESYYYNVKNLESYGNIPKLHLRQQRCVRCT